MGKIFFCQLPLNFLESSVWGPRRNITIKPRAEGRFCWLPAGQPLHPFYRFPIISILLEKKSVNPTGINFVSILIQKICIAQELRSFICHFGHDTPPAKILSKCCATGGSPYFTGLAQMKCQLFGVTKVLLRDKFRRGGEINVVAMTRKIITA